jgi:3-oxoacyl-[acyl-carrier-protein] synthase II
MALREGVVPPTINVEKLDPAIKLDVVANVKREVDARAAIVNSFGFGGHNAALVLSRV